MEKCTGGKHYFFSKTSAQEILVLCFRNPQQQEKLFQPSLESRRHARRPPFKQRLQNFRPLQCQPKYSTLDPIVTIHGSLQELIPCNKIQSSFKNTPPNTQSYSELVLHASRDKVGQKGWGLALSGSLTYSAKRSTCHGSIHQKWKQDSSVDTHNERREVMGSGCLEASSALSLSSPLHVLPAQFIIQGATTGREPQRACCIGEKRKIFHGEEMTHEKWQWLTRSSFKVNLTPFPNPQGQCCP